MLKKEYVDLMQEMLGKDLDKYMLALEDEPTKGILCNLQKMTIEGIKSNLHTISPMPYGKGLFYNDQQEKYGNHPLHMTGGFYCSEPSSMIVVSAMSHLNLVGKTVLDVCASPGGKSVGLANLIGDTGLLVSNEVVPSRAKILLSNMERMGYINSIVTSADVSVLAREYDSCFDVVLVDAPCSGEGMFRKDEQAQNLWSIEEVQSNAIKQLGILEDASCCVKENGYLMYSTCTFNNIEDDGVVEAFLNNHPEFEKAEIEDSCKAYLVKSKFGYRFFPHKAKGEGQFLSLLRKKSGFDYSLPIARVKEGKELQIAKNWVKENFSIPFPVYFTFIGSRVCMLNRLIVDTKNCHALTCGVQVGEILKNRLEPHHQIFSAYGKYMKNKYELDDEQVKKFVNGEELTADIPNGYACVFYKGCALGGVKAVNGILKNKYPKGLRVNH